MGRDEAVEMVERTGEWRVGERRGGGVCEGYQVGDGVVAIGRDELSYGRYMRDAMFAIGRDGREELVQSFIVTCQRTTARV
jgi:hypothetical protein